MREENIVKLFQCVTFLKIPPRKSPVLAPETSEQEPHRVTTPTAP
jgi:hypothetical protein